jgi:protein-tyrosine-phosphatase
MAEGIFRTRNQMNIEVYSAGSEPTVINPLAIQVMREMGIDISKQRSKSLQEFLGQRYDYVITVCDRMRESCPIFPDDPLQIHWSFPDPAEVQGSENERLNAFREIAIQLNTRIAYLLLVIERRASESKNPRDDNQL